MYIEGGIPYSAAPAPFGDRWQPGQAPPPATPSHDNDNDALRPASGVVISVFIGVLCWLALIFAFSRMGIF